jgi:hypothetical protein
MADFKPKIAFRDHAAKVLNVKPSELAGGANEEATAKTMPNTVGGAWAYTMMLESNPDREVRGWVTADATVITPDQNLGRLFEEAGAWKSSVVTAAQLADAIAWSYGENNLVLIDPGAGMLAPKLTVADDGTGTFKFFVGYRRSGPGGAGGGPRSAEVVNVVLSADHQAKLTRTQLERP